MIDYATWQRIRHLHRVEKLTVTQIARAASLDARTVRRWLDEPQFRAWVTPARPSKLDPYKSYIVRLLEHHRYSAVQIRQRLREAGYDGGFTVSQTLEHFLGCHLNAFEFFQSRVPARIMVDNLKSAVLQRAVGQAPVFHPRYADFARHHRFEIAPCNVGAGHEKGRVEAGVGYVKKNFLAGLDIPDFSALNPACRHWLDTVANVRIHAETKQRPVDRFNEERDQLRCFPDVVSRFFSWFPLGI